jgi:hypothetical protein
MSALIIIVDSAVGRQQKTGTVNWQMAVRRLPAAEPATDAVTELYFEFFYKNSANQYADGRCTHTSSE